MSTSLPYRGRVEGELVSLGELWGCARPAASAPEGADGIGEGRIQATDRTRRPPPIHGWWWMGGRFSSLALRVGTRTPDSRGRQEHARQLAAAKQWWMGVGAGMCVCVCVYVGVYVGGGLAIPSTATHRQQ